MSETNDYDGVEVIVETVYHGGLLRLLYIQGEKGTIKTFIVTEATVLLYKDKYAPGTLVIESIQKIRSNRLIVFPPDEWSTFRLNEVKLLKRDD